MANHDGKRICTWKSWDCPYETTILARGEVYLGLGTYDLQWAVYYWLCTGRKTALVGYGRLLRPLGASSLIPLTTCLCGIQVDSGVCRGLLACWPSCRMQQSIHYHIGLQQTSAYSGTTSCYKRCWATVAGIPLHLRQGVLLDHSGREGVSSRIIFE